MNETTNVGNAYIRSTRGIITAHNHRGTPIPMVSLQQWLRYTRQVLNAEKIDVVAYNQSVAILSELIPFADEIGCKLALRTNAAASPSSFHHWQEKILHDITLCPSSLNAPTCIEWLDCCKEYSIPVHLNLLLNDSFEGLETWIREYAIRTVTFSVSDVMSKSAINAFDIDALISAVEKIKTLDVSITIQDIPFCALPKSLWPYVVNTKQDLQEHLGYIPTSIVLARSIYGHRIFVGTKIIRMILARHTLHKTPVDEILLPFILKRSYRYVIARFIRRISEHLRIMGSIPRTQRATHYDLVLKEFSEPPQIPQQLICRECHLWRICDHASKAPDSITPKKVDGEVLINPMHFRHQLELYYDAIDAERLKRQRPSQALLTEALHILKQQQPTKILTSEEYSMEDSFSESMEGGVKWWSVTNSEKTSTPLGKYHLPFTIEVEVGAGIADYIGFSFAKHIKIVCPMNAYRHTLALHVNASGEFLLLRDGHPVQPVEFEGLHYLPLRLGTLLQPRLTVWNIDDCILTQGLKIWESAAGDNTEHTQVKYSMIIVSTQFTRRLQAVLHNLAHQQNFDLSSLEIIIAYVPGLDATDDLIDSIELIYPSLKIIRSAFPKELKNSKGLMINESFKLTTGEWVVLLDSDILLPPHFFERLDAVSDTESFIAPDGRRLLTPQTTASILLGDTQPWIAWDTLVNDSGEFRHRETQGIPVGFCQCFKSEYLAKHPYVELEHFETADMEFGKYLLRECGEEYRLSGVPVLHLDHNGSQWYGTRKQM